MNRRVPLSRASVVIAELRRCSPQLRWDQLPHDACSDDAAIDAGMREAVDSYRAEGYGLNELGAARRAQERGEHATTGRTMPPHVRAAHFTHYWVGPRKGRTDGRPGNRCIVHWIPPIAVHGGGGEEVVHRVRRH